MSLLLSHASRASRAHGLPSWRALTWGAMLLPVAIVVGVALTFLHGQRPAAGAPATASDPRLILYPRTVRVAALLPGGRRLEGSLYPALLGPNRLSVQMRGAGMSGGRVEVTATMRGMAMAPVRATLVAHRHGYSGALRLPMFGQYRARVVVVTPSGRYSGALTLALSLPRS